MKRHAVPQNIMDVEFKLFGSLTIRQFGLLFSNVMIALFIYIVLPPELSIIKWPIIVFFVSLGLAMALLTVNGLPFNVWFGNFLLALTTSQKRVWKKSPARPDILKSSYRSEGKYSTKKVSESIKAQSEMPLLKDEAFTISKKVDNKEEAELESLDKHFKNNFDNVELDLSKYNKVNQEIENTTTTNSSEKSVRTFSNIIADPNEDIDLGTITRERTVQKDFQDKVLQNQSESDKTFDTENNNLNENQRIIESSSPNSKEKIVMRDEEDINPTPITKDAITLNQELNELSKESILMNKIEELEKKLLEMQEKDQNDDVINMQKEIAEEIDKTTQEMKQKDEVLNQEEPDLDITIKPAQRPNIVVGVVLSKDDQPVPDVTVEIKDDENFPIRKVVTDRLGQFSIPTPLPNGEYLIDFTKKGRNFTDYRITLNGQILPILRFKEAMS